jgi:hypothetical protein
VYIVFRDAGPRSYPAVISVFRTRKRADEEAETLNKASGTKLHWSSSVRVTA